MKDRSNSGNVSLSKLRGRRKGDEIKIKINTVVRQNFKDAIEDFKDFNPKVISIPLY